MTDSLTLGAEAKKLGRNQKMAVAIAGVVFVASVVLVGIGRVEGAAWLTFSADLAKWTIGLILTGSAVVKVADAFGGSRVA